MTPRSYVSHFQCFLKALSLHKPFALMNSWLQKLSFPGKIWRLGLDPQRAELLIETRDAAQKRAIFFSTPCSKPQQVPLALALPDPWWVSLYGGWQGTIIIQGYSDPTLPIPQGIYVYDRPDGSLRWSDPLRRCVGLTSEGLLARHAQFPQRYEQLSLVDGRAQTLSAEAWHLARQASDALLSADLRFPQATAMADLPIPSQDLDPAPFPDLPIDHLAISSHLHLIAWYARQPNDPSRLSQHLAIWQKGNFEFTTRLRPAQSQLAPDSFMVYQQTLIWYDQHELYLVDLASTRP